MPETINIVVIDDHPLILEGLTSTLDSVDDFKVLGQGGNYTDALDLANEMLPEIILLDISMPGGGVEAARDIHLALPEIKLIILTASEDENDVKSALQAGVNAYILKGIGGKELIDIVRWISSGQTFISPSLAGDIFSHSFNEESSQATNLLDDLNDRENSVLKGLERGLTNKQIADELFLSEKTIKHYMTSILQKLQVKNRLQAALLAKESHEIN